MRNVRFSLLAIASLVSALVFSVALTGCKEQKVPNGEIPDEYMQAAQKYMGYYGGKMEGNRGVLKFSFQGKKVLAQYSDNRGQDILDPRCDSKIGDLIAVKVDKKSSGYVLERAVFAYDPNLCWPSVHGREIVFDFSENSSQIRVNVSLLLEQEWERDCRIDPGNPSQGRPPTQICTDRPVTRFASGRFTR
ncbi:MAG: hypothetical protein AAB250_00655 [Bdellovibrionota bacterium]